VSTNKQFKANRRNALKSTGPKSIEGKAVASKNALKHGLLSKELLLPDEDAKTLIELRRGIYKALQPEGTLEELLLDRIIFGFWRLKRLGIIETDHFIMHEQRFLRGYKFMILFGRYETMIERSLYRALHELQHIQANRTGIELTDSEQKID
jgi:hypothetical protein